jgi:hypothetical protein
VDRHWEQRLERAAYETERAARQYRLVEPENRLVARQLERDWEEKLKDQRRLEEERRRAQRQQPRGLSEAERETIRRLAADVPELWASPGTSDLERKQIIRQVIDRVVIDAQGNSERVGVAIEWAGGTRMKGEFVRPVAKLEQLSYYPRMQERVREMVVQGQSPGAIAERLNAEGFRPPKRRERYGRQGVRNLIGRMGLMKVPSNPANRIDLSADEWPLAQLAKEVPMPAVTLYNWMRRGWLKARRSSQRPQRWIIWADAQELTRLRELHSRPQGYYTRRLWAEEKGADHQATSAAVTP